jgi:hypothetical protein
MNIAYLTARSIAIATLTLLTVSCSKPVSETAEAYTDPTDALPARFKTQEPVAKPDFSAAAQKPEFQQAITDAAALLEAEPLPMRSIGEDEEIPGGVSFEVPRKKVDAILRKAHTAFLAKGFYLFRYEQNYALQGRLEKVGLLPTADYTAVMAAMDTNGNNFNISTAGVIAWMKELHQEQPFILTDIGFDYMEGYFTKPVADPPKLAQRMYQFCPDIVDQGVGDMDKLALELKKGKLYFWWD